MRLREQLRADIVAGIWPLGSHVTLAQLADHYKVSANPVREALLQLQGEGVVAMRMNRGAVIPMVDAKYIDNVYRVRGAIQAMLAREAARCATDEQIATMRTLAARHGQASDAGDVAGSLQANRELHRFIDSIPDNPVAVEMLEGRSHLVDAIRRSKGYGLQRLEAVRREHAEMIDAIAARDPERAAKAALAHTDSARLDLLAMVAAS